MRLAAVVTVLLLGGCGETGPGAGALAVRDSAGIAIVQNPARAVEDVPRWKAAAEPEVDIGALEGEPEYQLARVSDAITLSDGSVVVGMNSPPEVRVFGPGGEYRRTIGTEGEGPGEFRNVREVFRLAGDRLLVHDWRLGRLSRFTAAGGLVESIELRPHSSSTSVAGRLGDGTLLANRFSLMGDEGPPPGGMDPARSILLRHAPDGTLRDTLLIRQDRELWVSRQGRGTSWIAPLVWTQAFAAADSGGLYTAHSRAWEYRVREGDGTVRRIVRLDRRRRRVTESERDSLLERRLSAHEDDPRRRRQRAESFEAMPEVERHPAFDRMMLDEVDNVWFREAAGSGEGSDRWLVFGPDGRLRATARLPARLHVTSIGEDVVVGVWRDELDVAHVRVYRIER